MSGEERVRDYALGMAMLNATLSTDGVGKETRYFVSGTLEMGVGLTHGNLPHAQMNVRIELPEFIYRAYEKELLAKPDARMRLSGDLSAKIEVPCMN